MILTVRLCCLWIRLYCWKRRKGSRVSLCTRRWRRCRRSCFGIRLGFGLVGLVLLLYQQAKLVDLIHSHARLIAYVQGVELVEEQREHIYKGRTQRLGLLARQLIRLVAVEQERD